MLYLFIHTNVKLYYIIKLCLFALVPTVIVLSINYYYKEPRYCYNPFNLDPALCDNVTYRTISDYEALQKQLLCHRNFDPEKCDLLSFHTETEFETFWRSLNHSNYLCVARFPYIEYSLLNYPISCYDNITLKKGFPVLFDNNLHFDYY